MIIRSRALNRVLGVTRITGRVGDCHMCAKTSAVARLNIVEHEIDVCKKCGCAYAKAILRTLTRD